MVEENWVEVGRATTNRTPDSNVDIFLDLDKPPICPNMTDADFRTKILVLREISVSLITTRLSELAAWTPAAKQRVSDWFGQSDEATRERLLSGLGNLRKVMREIQPKQIVRYSAEVSKYTGCLPIATDTSHTDASVCKPDTATHTICIHPHFCGRARKTCIETPCLPR